MKVLWEFLALAIIPITVFAQSGLPEAEAIELLSKELPQDRLKCVSFATEVATPEYFEIALREKHNFECGGDPASAPTSGRFRIDRADKSISKYDAITGEYGTPKIQGGE